MTRELNNDRYSEMFVILKFVVVKYFYIETISGRHGIS